MQRMIVEIVAENKTEMADLLLQLVNKALMNEYVEVYEFHKDTEKGSIRMRRDDRFSSITAINKFRWEKK